MFAKRYKRRLEVQKDQGLYRNPPQIQKRDGCHCYISGRRILSFASNDYLGISALKNINEKICENYRKYPTSSSSSRLVSGNYSAINEAEEVYANYFGYDEALFLPSGYQANLGIISTFFEKGDTIIFDKQIHASSVKGMTMSGASLKGYRHNNMGHLEKRLNKSDREKTAVLTESLFSMEGDLLKTEDFAGLKEEYNFLSVVDEAHAFGVLGEKGRGIAGNTADIALGTFGKAFGLFGAFVLMPKDFKDYLFNFASPLIYSTALPEAHAASVLDLLEFVGGCDEKRAGLSQKSSYMRSLLETEGFKAKGDAHIISVEIGEEGRAVEICRELLKNDILAFSARYPTVPRGRAIIRLGMSVLHHDKDIKEFVEKLKKAAIKCNHSIK
ncbi:aminotransferase class I/II-fold pyridoxal phosphate-dependent enzyme [Desulfobacterales bacterium HSG16]|nr:aminotransferase class I/II-fold pyridoxal phosphate-dependent enzyme [Desulfobacterales bacterium HSG16]